MTQLRRGERFVKKIRVELRVVITKEQIINQFNFAAELMVIN